MVNVSQSGEQVKVSVTAVPRPEVQTSVQTATVSYADVIKRGVCSVSVPKAKVQQVIQTEPQVTLQMQYDVDASGPSHVQVTNSESRPPVISICASRSQASAKYGKYRNKQCMANSLVFLSFLHEDEFITRADLNRVLDKGHAMYSDARKRFVKSVFLACDELPTVVTSRRHEYQVDMSQFARHGTFDGTDHLPSLEQGLHCLDSEFRYALLVMGGNVIAVCKLTSGEYAYFDPHPRMSTGMPLSLCDEDSDTEAAKAKLRPLLTLLKEPEAASLTIEQILSRCNLTMNEYEQCLQDINKKTALILKRDPKDCWINNYNPHLLEAWNSNLDVSLILNAYSCIEYLCKYITKKESGLSEYLKTVIDNSDKNTVNECDEMRAVMQAYSKKREISAQECVTRVCGLKMKKCSRSVVFVPTDDNPVKMSRPMSYLETTTHDSCNIWMTSLSDKYKCRPETPEYEEMSLADFAALCRLVSGPNEGKDVLPLLNQLGFVQRRKNDKPGIIRYYHCSQEKDPEQYYGRLLRLYLPHRSEQELKPQGFQTYQSFYNSGFVRLPCSDHSESVKRVVKRNKDKYEKNSEDIESALEEFEQNRDVVIDEWCNLAPESEVVRLQCDENLPERHSDDENEQENVPDYSRQSDAVTEIRAIREQPAVDPAVVVRSENDGHIIKLGLRMDNRQPMRHNRSANAASDDLVYIERAEESLKFKGADLDEKKIYANTEVNAALQTMRQASVEEMMPLLQVRETASRPDTLTHSKN
ncbi:unnamed protein product [Oreochromis niloticus]|nr:unnamed protein product [Mustela putorius furo]